MLSKKKVNAGNAKEQMPKKPTKKVAQKKVIKQKNAKKEEVPLVEPPKKKGRILI